MGYYSDSDDSANDCHQDDYYSDPDSDNEVFSCVFEGCDSSFNSNKWLNNHLINMHNYCFACRKKFGSPRALQQHLTSPRHTGVTVNCPLCSRKFKGLSSIASHVESGYCPKGNNLDIYKVANAIRMWETAAGAPNTFTKKLLEWGNSNGGRPSTINEIIDDNRNGGFTCRLCNRDFSTKNSAKQHAMSKKHVDHQYRCTNCPREFTSLSGLLQHFEKTRCGTEQSHVVKELFKNLHKMITYN